MDLIICIQKLDEKILKLQENLERKLTRLGQFIHTYLQFQMIFDEIKMIIQNAIFYIGNLKTKLNMLALNHLSTSTISPGDLKTLLVEIQSKLAMNYELSKNPNIDIWYFYKSRKENPQKLTQLSSRSHPRHLVGKRTSQKTPS